MSLYFLLPVCYCMHSRVNAMYRMHCGKDIIIYFYYLPCRGYTHTMTYTHTHTHTHESHTNHTRRNTRQPPPCTLQPRSSTTPSRSLHAISILDNYTSARTTHHYLSSSHRFSKFSRMIFSFHSFFFIAGTPLSLY